MSQISPGIILAIVVTLVAAQATRVFAPRSGNYLLALALAVAGLIVGELIALSGILVGPGLGVLHPLPDLVAMVVAEIAGVTVAGQRPHPG